MSSTKRCPAASKSWVPGQNAGNPRSSRCHRGRVASVMPTGANLLAYACASEFAQPERTDGGSMRDRMARHRSVCPGRAFGGADPRVLAVTRSVLKETIRALPRAQPLRHRTPASSRVTSRRPSGRGRTRNSIGPSCTPSHNRFRRDCSSPRTGGTGCSSAYPTPRRKRCGSCASVTARRQWRRRRRPPFAHSFADIHL
jgi:hypothetical protein